MDSKLNMAVRKISKVYHEQFQGTQEQRAIDECRQAILNLPNHYIYHNHSNCGDGWCKEKESSKQPIPVSEAIKYHLKVTVNNLAIQAETLCRRKNTNSNEEFNSLASSMLGDKRRHYGNTCSALRRYALSQTTTLHAVSCSVQGGPLNFFCGHLLGNDHWFYSCSIFLIGCMKLLF